MLMVQTHHPFPWRAILKNLHVSSLGSALPLALCGATFGFFSSKTWSTHRGTTRDRSQDRSGSCVDARFHDYEALHQELSHWSPLRADRNLRPCPLADHV